MRGVLATPANKLTLGSTRLDIEQVELVENILRELRKAYTLDDRHLLYLAALLLGRVAVAPTLALGIIALLEVELADLDALQVQLVLALVL